MSVKFKRPMGGNRWFGWLLGMVLVLSSLLTGCSIPRVTAEERIFLNPSLEFVGEYRLPETTFDGTQVGGLSAIAYDRQRDRVYVLSDDRSNGGPARFYTLKMALDSTTPASGIKMVEIEKVTALRQADGQPYPSGAIDPEGIGISPQGSVFISSEGNPPQGIDPFIGEFDLETGILRQSLPLPKRYLPGSMDANQPMGIQTNAGFEALTLSPGSSGSVRLDPFRVFVATETPLQQDQTPTADGHLKNRFLHYLIGDGPPLLIAEHLYPLDAPVGGSLVYGLTELLALDQGGHFLSLERSFGLTGFRVQIYELATGGATDTSGLASLKNLGDGITPIRKQLVLDLNRLGIRLDNLEGMTLGPRLPDGSQSVILVSDNNFRAAQVTQFLLFRLRVNNSGV